MCVGIDERTDYGELTSVDVVRADVGNGRDRRDAENQNLGSPRRTSAFAFECSCRTDGIDRRIKSSSTGRLLFRLSGSDDTVGTKSERTGAELLAAR